MTMDTAIMEIEAQETAALLADEQPQPRGRIGATRAASILCAGALALVGAKTFWHSKVQASPEGIVVLSGSGTSGVCSHNGWDCRDTKCCIDPASKCYQKNEHWSSCNETCSTNTMWDGGWVTTDKEEEQWGCKEIVKDAEEIVKDAGAHALEKGACCCPKEDEVESMDACQQALQFIAKSLGFDSEAEELGWNGTNENIPPGCSFKVWPNGKTGRGHWNRAEKGKARDNMIPICRTAAEPEAESEAEGEGEEAEAEGEGEEEGEEGSQAVECTAAGESCAESKCCSDAYHKCYQKTDGWASCNASCSSKMKWVDGKWAEQDEDVWDCKELVSDASGSTEGETAQDICVKDGENCMLSKCCLDAGHKCYKKDDHWASCNSTCSSNYKWEADGWVDNGEKVWECDELVHDDSESEKSFCDMSACDDTPCREKTERDCCLTDMCKTLEGNELASCQDQNLQTCCEGKSGDCTSEFP